MIFKTWLTDLAKVQGVVNNIKNIDILTNGATNLLDSDVVNSLSSEINGLNLQQAQLALSTRNLTQEQMNQVLVQGGLLASEDRIQAELVQSALAQAGLSAEKQKAILTDLNLMSTDTGEILTTQACTKEKLLEILATKGVTGANAEAIVSSLGLAGANSGLSVSFEVLSSSIKKTMTSLAMNPMTWIMAIPAVIYGCVKAYDALTVTAEEAKESVDNARSEFEESSSHLLSLNDELESTNEKIAELESKGTLTFTDKAELENLKEQNHELEKNIHLQEEKTKNAASKVVAEIKDNKNTLDRDFNIALNNYSGYKKEVESIKKSLSSDLNAGNITFDNYEQGILDLEDSLDNYKTRLIDNIEVFEKNKQSIIDKYSTSDSSQFLASDKALYDDIQQSLQEAYRALYSYSDYNKFVIEPVFNEEKFKGLQEQLLEYFVKGGQANSLALQKEFGLIITDLQNAFEKEGIDFNKVIGDLYSNATLKLDQIAPIVDKPNGNFEAHQNWISRIIRNYIQNELSDEDRTILLNAEIPKETKFKTIEDVQNFINELKEKAGSNKNSIPTSLSNLLTEEENQKLDSITSKMSSLGEAYQKLTSGSYTNSDILQIAQDFGITADNAEDLADLVKGKLNRQIAKSIGEINELEAGTDDPALIEQLETVKKALIGIGSEAETAKGEVDAALRIQVASDIDTDDTLNSLGDIESAISALGSLYDEYKDKDTKAFSVESLNTLNTEMGELNLSSYEKFMDYLNETGNKADKADGKLQELFDNIISEYIGASGILDMVTDDNKNVVENILKQWGVLNADEVVSQAAEANRKYEEEYKIVNENEYEVNGQKVKGLKGLYEEYYNALLAGDYETADEIENTANGLINELSGSYQTDLENWKDLLVKKKEAYETFDKELSKRMGDDYDPDKTAEENVDAYIAGNPNLSDMDRMRLEREAKLYDTDYDTEIETAEEKVGKKEGTGKYKGNKGKGKFNLNGIKLTQSDASKSKDNSSSSANSGEQIDWIARKLEILQKKLSKTQAEFDNLLTYRKKDSNLAKQINQLNTLLNVSGKAAKKYKEYADNVKLSDSLKAKVRSGDYDISNYGTKKAKKIDKYQDYYDKYLENRQKADEYETQIREKKEERYQLKVDKVQAKIDKSDARIELNSGNAKKQNNQLDDQSEYYKESYKYQIKIAELNGEDIKAEQLKLELKQKLRDIEKQKFDNIQNQYSNEISELENAGNRLSDKVSLLEARGAAVTSKIYEKQINNQQEIKAALLEEKASLQKQLANIKEGTDAWYEAKNALADVDSEINSCNTSIVEMYNNITELSRNIYNNLISAFHSVTEEADFLAGLMSNRNMFDDKDGQITDEGLATLGTYVSGYYTSKQSSQKIGTVVELFGKELEKAKSYDFTNSENPWRFFNPLTEKDEYFSSYEEMEAAYKEFYQGQRDEISKTSEYENKIIDMVKQSLESELAVMQKLVDSKKEALQAEKDLHDYQNTIADSTKNISSIQKQITALQGDNSEEGRARVQKLQKELEDAQEELNETEYDHLISAQQDMLDNLIEEYEDALNEEMGDVEHLLKKGTKMVNDGLGDIKDTIDSYCNNYEYKLENIDNLYSNTGSIADNVGKILEAITGDKQKNGNTGTNNLNTVLDNLKEWSEDFSLSDPTKLIDFNYTDKDLITSEFAEISNEYEDAYNGIQNRTEMKKGSADESSIKALKNALHVLGFDSGNPMTEAEINEGKWGTKLENAIKNFKNYKGLSSTSGTIFGDTALEALKSQLKLAGKFSTGGIVSEMKRFAQSHGESGWALVRKGEGILTPEMANTFTYDLIPRMDDIINASRILADIPAMTETTAAGNIEANFAFNLENVRDANDLIQQIQTNQNVRKAMQEVTIKQLTDSGTRLSVNHYH